MKYPKAYLITFTTHGTWLHGAEKGSVDRDNNEYSSPLLPANSQLEEWEHNQSDGVVRFNKQERDVVLESIIFRCRSARWELIAAHVRLHAVIKAECLPKDMMISLKSFATKGLTKRFARFKTGKIWTANGSNRYLWDCDSIKRAVRYTLYEQGEAMAVFQKVIG